MIAGGAVGDDEWVVCWRVGMMGDDGWMMFDDVVRLLLLLDTATIKLSDYRTPLHHCDATALKHYMTTTTVLHSDKHEQHGTTTQQTS